MGRKRLLRIFLETQGDVLTSTPELSRGGSHVEGLGVQHLSQQSVVGSGILMVLSGRRRRWQSGAVPPKGVVAALPTTPPVGLGGDRGACPRSLLERRWGRTAGVAMRTCIDQSVC